MGFKLKSQKAVKQGGFKLMGSSPMKEDDVEAKIYGVNRADIVKDQPGVTYTEDEAALNINMPSFPDIDIVAERDKKPSAFGPIADAINNAAETATEGSDVGDAVQKAMVTTKKRKVDGKTRVEKKSYTTKDGVGVTVKRKFDSAGNLKKVKKKVKKDGVITKAKNKLLGNRAMKVTTRKAGDPIPSNIPEAAKRVERKLRRKKGAKELNLMMGKRGSGNRKFETYNTDKDIGFTITNKKKGKTLKIDITNKRSDNPQIKGTITKNGKERKISKRRARRLANVYIDEKITDKIDVKKNK